MATYLDVSKAEAFKSFSFQKHVQSIGGPFCNQAGRTRRVWLPFMDQDFCSWVGNQEGTRWKLPGCSLLCHPYSSQSNGKPSLKSRRQHLVKIIWTPRVYEAEGFTKQFLFTSVAIRNQLHSFLLIHACIFTPLLSSCLPIEENGASRILDDDSCVKAIAKIAGFLVFCQNLLLKFIVCPETLKLLRRCNSCNSKYMHNTDPLLLCCTRYAISKAASVCHKCIACNRVQLWDIFLSNIDGLMSFYKWVLKKKKLSWIVLNDYI